MRKALAGTALAMIMALAACGPGGPATPENVAIEVPGSEEYQQRLLAMPEGGRNAVFFRAIQDSGVGRECQHVQSSSQAGEEQGFPVWQATCQDGSVWKILIANDGVAQVMTSAPDAELGIGDDVTAPVGPAGNEVAPVDRPPPAGNQQGQ